MPNRSGMYNSDDTSFCWVGYNSFPFKKSLPVNIPLMFKGNRARMKLIKYMV